MLRADDAGKHVLKLEKAALDRWQKGDVYGFVNQAADHISYFDPSLKRRLDGKKPFEAYLKPINGTFKIYRYEILNPKMYTDGDMVVLCFNLNNYNKKGKITSQWNSTEVYQMIKGKWKIIHSHWSRTKTVKTNQAEPQQCP